MNAALGGVSAGGFGNPLFDVTQSGGGPNELVANQSDGNAGGVTLSKFSSNTIGREQGPHDGDGSGVAPITPERSTRPRPFSSREVDPVWLMAREEPIGPIAAMPATITVTSTEITSAPRFSISNVRKPLAGPISKRVDRQNRRCSGTHPLCHANPNPDPR
jgi:hypothetical protein